MFRSWWPLAVAVAVPGLLLAGFGVTHPSGLHAGNAHWWATLHILLLPVLPLLAVSQWVLLTPAARSLRWAGRLAAYGYATFYSGLDAVAGIAAGTVEEASGGVSPLTGKLFKIGDALGYVGAWSFLVGSVCVVAGIAPRAGWRAAPGAVLLLAACVSFLDSHLFWPRGVFTMVAIGRHVPAELGRCRPTEGISRPVTRWSGSLRAGPAEERGPVTARSWHEVDLWRLSVGRMVPTDSG